MYYHILHGILVSLEIRDQITKFITVILRSYMNCGRQNNKKIILLSIIQCMLLIVGKVYHDAAVQGSEIPP